MNGGRRIDAENPDDGHREDPAEAELQTSARLVLFLAGRPRLGPGDVPTSDYTQAGLAAALGASQGSIARIVGRLVEGGVLRTDQAHIRQRFRRLHFYRLTPLGELLAHRIALANSLSHQVSPSPPSRSDRPTG